MTLPLADIAVGLGAGLALGGLKLAWLRASLARPGGLARGRVLASAAARIAVVVGALWLVALVADRPGAALAAALVGLLAARAVGLRRLIRDAPGRE